MQEEKQQKNEEVEEAFFKNIFKHDNGDLFFEFWNTTDVTELGATMTTFKMASLSG